MWQPGVRGEIERRLLVNYRVDPEVLARALPAPFHTEGSHRPRAARPRSSGSGR
jgi:hypothetical protein